MAFLRKGVRTEKETDRTMSRAPIDSIDAFIGQRLRTRRTDLKMSQDKLGQEVGITFQQVQKYERGANRISASRLWMIAKALGVHVSYFFADLGPNAGREAMGSGMGGGLETAGLAEAPAAYAAGPVSASSTDESLRLIEAFTRIQDTHVRAGALRLVEAIANSTADPAAAPQDAASGGAGAEVANQT